MRADPADRLRRPELWVCNLGVVEYDGALELQERLRRARQEDAIPDVLLQLEHPPIYTRGRRSGEGELPFGEDWYRSRGIEIVDTRRGGKITYHGPGQLVGYPIVGVEDVVAYVRLLERAIVAALGEEGIAAADRSAEGPAYTGVWVEHTRKIASIGVHVSRGVAAHGYAVNVNNSLEPFGWVVACGLPEVEMTSVAAELGGRAPAGADLAATAARHADRIDSAVRERLPCFRKRMSCALARELGLRQRLVTLDKLERYVGDFAETEASAGAFAVPSA